MDFLVHELHRITNKAKHRFEMLMKAGLMIQYCDVLIKTQKETALFVCLFVGLL